MTDPKVWADLAQRFLDIKADEHGIVVGYGHFPEGNTRIVWAQCPSGSEVAKKRFLIIVAEAGALLDPRDPTDTWLREVSIQGKCNDRKADRQFNPATPGKDLVPCISGTVINPGETSVLICLHRQWLATEERSRASAFIPAPLVSTEVVPMPRGISLDELMAESRDRAKRTRDEELSNRLDELVADLDITHEDLAHRMKLGKTAYFAVKGGNGGKSSRFKVNSYLDKHHKKQSDRP